MNFLYFSMLLFKNYSIGPNKRLKAYLFIETSTQYDFVFILA